MLFLGDSQSFFYKRDDNSAIFFQSTFTIFLPEICQYFFKIGFFPITLSYHGYEGVSHLFSIEFKQWIVQIQDIIYIFIYSGIRAFDSAITTIS